jgi:hypothetical protein
MLTLAMLRRLLLVVAALSLVRVYAVETFAMANSHAGASSKPGEAIIANRQIYG